MSERIAAAAIRVGGQVRHMLPPARHHNVMHRFYRKTGVVVGPDEQGFITDTGRYVDREEALKIAVFAGQIIRRSGGDHATELFSEDMW